MMAGTEKIIYVYDDFSEDNPILIGKMYVGVIKGGETYSFEYDMDWLAKNKLSISIDPELQPYGGRQFPTGKRIFGVFADASPDRWGRILMNKRERILAEKEGRKPRKLYDSDYLLVPAPGVSAYTILLSASALPCPCSGTGNAHSGT